jgi:hypothetical protein
MTERKYVLLHPADMAVEAPHYHIGVALRDEGAEAWKLESTSTVGCDCLASEEADIRDQDIFKLPDDIIRFKLAEMQNGDFTICGRCVGYFYTDAGITG